MKAPTIDTNVKAESTRGVVRWAGQMIASLLIGGAILFVTAGRLDWLAGWTYLGMNALTQVLSALVLIPRRSDMIAERSQVREGTKPWDRFLAPAIVVAGSFAIIITAGLDARFAWSGVMNGFLWGASLVFAFACQMFVLWAMDSNPFFAATVRIQQDRQHTVVTGGPYSLVRHPGYLGSALYTLACPLVLTSWWTFIPALLTVLLLVVRTALEDRALQDELPGYREYAATVRYRLIPGSW